MKMLWDNKAVNNLTVAVVSGLAVFTFFSNVVGMLFDDLFGSTTTSAKWVWHQFWVDLAVLVVLLFVAMWINNQAKD